MIVVWVVICCKYGWYIDNCERDILLSLQPGRHHSPSCPGVAPISDSSEPYQTLFPSYGQTFSSPYVYLLWTSLSNPFYLLSLYYPFQTPLLSHCLKGQWRKIESDLILFLYKLRVLWLLEDFDNLTPNHNTCSAEYKHVHLLCSFCFLDEPSHLQVLQTSLQTLQQLLFQPPPWTVWIGTTYSSQCLPNPYHQQSPQPLPIPLTVQTENKNQFPSTHPLTPWSLPPTTHTDPLPSLRSYHPNSPLLSHRSPNLLL